MTTLATEYALTDNRDPIHAIGRADAHDELTNGATPDILEQRLAWLSDPISPYPTAYLNGYRARITDSHATAYTQQRSITHHDDYWTRSAR
ncbi:hypothetical protein [Streptomyces zhihengii]